VKKVEKKQEKDANKQKLIELKIFNHKTAEKRRAKGRQSPQFFICTFGPHLPVAVMPASLSLSSLDMMEPNSNRTEQLALQLALLQGNFDNPGHHHHHNHPGHGTPSFSASDLNLGTGSGSLLLNGSAVGGGSLEDLKGRRSQNMTECVPVPSSEHVAEIVGRQGESYFYQPWVFPIW